MGVEEVGEWMSDDDLDGMEEEEEWRKVRPTGTPYVLLFDIYQADVKSDKELRRYLVSGPRRLAQLS